MQKLSKTDARFPHTYAADFIISIDLAVSRADASALIEKIASLSGTDLTELKERLAGHFIAVENAKLKAEVLRDKGREEFMPLIPQDFHIPRKPRPRN